MKRVFVCLMIFTLLLCGCKGLKVKGDGVYINLSDGKITVDGKKISKDSTKAVYSANDIVFYLAGQDFTYGEGTEEDSHEQSEADAHTVVHITKPGRYVLSGKLSLGQIAVDLGEDAQDDPEAVVTLVLNGVDITCKVAPAVIFYNVYECGEKDEKTASKDADTSKAGANVIVSDGTENNVNGSYVAKIYKSVELSDDGTEVKESKKLHKYDAAFYSKMSMNIGGEEKGDGVLNINAENEGLGTELHLTVNGAVLNIASGNDGINTNEDNVSVTTINSGAVNVICTGATGEGDGIDSNGWLVINGGTVTAQACSSSPDSGIDSDKGIFINGGKVVASGNMLDHIAGGDATYAVFRFASPQDGKSTYVLKNTDGETSLECAPENSFTCLVVAGDELTAGDYTLWQGDTQLAATKTEDMQGMKPHGERPKMPDGEHGTPPEFPKDTKRPPMPNGERTKFSDDMEGVPPFGEIPPMPDFGMMPMGKTNEIFTIEKGANQFVNVCPKG